MYIYLQTITQANENHWYQKHVQRWQQNQVKNRRKQLLEGVT